MEGAHQEIHRRHASERRGVHAQHEGAVDDQLAAAFEQIEQARLAIRPLEYIGLVDFHPRHAPTLGGQRVVGAQRCLLLPTFVRGRPPAESLRIANQNRQPSDARLGDYLVMAIVVFLFAYAKTALLSK
jgi:hypothetical protein